MLSNRLTSILSVCSLLLVVNCTSKRKQGTEVALTSECRETNVLVQERALVISAKSQKKKNLVACFQNWLKFQKNKQQTLKTCSEIKIRKNGSVRYAQTISRTKEIIPKDFRWCLEQEFWKMNFAGLQLERDYQILFPLNFSSVLK